MLTWEAPAKALSSPAARRSNNAIDPKESQVFSVEGDLWRVAVEANDCDLHLELSAPGAGPAADRIIVEISQDPPYAATRRALLRHLAANHITIGGPVLTKPLRVHVTGFAFYDAFHFYSADPQRGHDHGTAFVGTLWEIHPVWQVTFN